MINKLVSCIADTIAVSYAQSSTHQIIFTMNTGLLTSLCAVASLVSVSVNPHDFCLFSYRVCVDPCCSEYIHLYWIFLLYGSSWVSAVDFMQITGNTKRSISIVYSNTLMATLNARQSIRGAVDDTMTVSLQKLKQAGSLPVTSKVHSRSIHALEWILIGCVLSAPAEQYCDQGGYCSRILSGPSIWGSWSTSSLSPFRPALTYQIPVLGHGRDEDK